MRTTALVTLLLCGLHAALLAEAGSVRADAEPWNVPGDVSELQRAGTGRRGLESFRHNGYLGIESGYQAILLGSKLPIGPAAHVPWARPYARGPIKVLIVTSFGNAAADVQQLAQVARELQVDVRWLLVADAAILSNATADELYRTQFLPEQARAVLREDYDVIVMTFGTYTPLHGVVAEHPYFPDDVYRTILDKVDRGTGLVLVGQNSAGYWVQRTPLAAALPAQMSGAYTKLDREVRLEAEPGATAFQLLGYPAHWFTPDRPLVLYDWQLQPGTQVLARVATKPAIMLRAHGQGRVLLLGWDGTLAPQRASGRMELEHDTALAARAIAFAARKEPELQLKLSQGPIAAGMPGELTAELSGAARIELTLRGEAFRKLHVLTVRAPAGRSRISLPKLAKGQYFVQVIARDERGRVLTWGDQALDVQAAADLTVETDKASYQVGEAVQIAGRAPGLQPESGLMVALEVRDATGRVLSRAEKPFAQDTRFEYPIRAARVAAHKAVITVSRAGAPLLQAAAQFFVPTFEWQDYENVLWAWPTAPNALLRDRGGFTSVFDGYGREDMGAAAAHYGLRVARLNDSGLEPSTVQTQPLIAAGFAPRLQRAIAAAQRHGALFWLLQDERHQLNDPGPPDAEGLARFRKYLHTHYASLSALNASWGTRLRAWDQVRPTLTGDVQPGVKNLAAWLDFRLYVADQAFELDAQQARMLRATFGAATLVGIDGFTSSPQVLPYGALDFGRLAAEGVFNFYAPYADDFVVSSLIKGAKAKYLGWATPRAEYFGAPWRDAFRGHWGTLRFFGPTFWSDFGFLQPAGRWTGESTRELRAGVGKLLMGSERESSPIVFLYSYPSLVLNSASRLWEARHGGAELARAAADSRNVMEQMLIHAGVSFGYQTTAQLERGGLAGKKLLILPRQMAVALPRTTLAVIEQFVRDGGIVLADLAPALCDEHGKPRAQGGLDGLFGVRTASESIVQGARDYLAGVLAADPLLPQGEWLRGEWYDQRLRVSDGRALGKHVADATPAFVVKQTGRGRALLLNLLLAPLWPGSVHPTAEQQALIQSILEAARIAPVARVQTDGGAAQRGYEINVLRDGPNRYVGFYAHRVPEVDPGAVRAHFAQDKHTYDVRAGRYLGLAHEVDLPLRERQAALFARLDYQLTSLTLRAPPTGTRGELLRVAIALGATAAPGRHVVHVQLSGPDGGPLPLYTQNVVVDGGLGELQLLPALNEPQGIWQISAREVVSGLTAASSVELR